jgi:hypothetical protein
MNWVCYRTNEGRPKSGAPYSELKAIDCMQYDVTEGVRWEEELLPVTVGYFLISIT